MKQLLKNLKKIFTIAFLLVSLMVFSQSETTYPKITGPYDYLYNTGYRIDQMRGLLFDGYYQVVFPVGINIWKSSRIGFSIELAPGIRAENGTSKVNNLLIHPGVLVALGEGFVFAGRVAFETSGRYGITPVVSKVVKKNKNSALYIATPLPIRFGNDLPTSFTAGFQIGLSF